jgi:hypothetical protein
MRGKDDDDAEDEEPAKHETTSLALSRLLCFPNHISSLRPRIHETTRRVEKISLITDRVENFLRSEEFFVVSR